MSAQPAYPAESWGPLWWVGRHVEFRSAGGDWVLGQVVSATSTTGPAAVDRVGQLPFEPVPGEAEAVLSIALLEGRRRVVVQADVYGGGAHGIAPDVVLTAQFPPEVMAWWRRLSTPAQRALITAAGRVPGGWVAEVSAARETAAADAKSWPSTVEAPNGFSLPPAERDFVVDLGLQRRFSRLADRVRQLSVGRPSSSSGPGRTPEQLGRDRDAAKCAWDTHRLALNDTHGSDTHGSDTHGSDPRDDPRRRRAAGRSATVSDKAGNTRSERTLSRPTR